MITAQFSIAAKSIAAQFAIAALTQSTKAAKFVLELALELGLERVLELALALELRRGSVRCGWYINFQ